MHTWKQVITASIAIFPLDLRCLTGCDRHNIHYLYERYDILMLSNITEPPRHQLVLSVDTSQMPYRHFVLDRNLLLKIPAGLDIFVCVWLPKTLHTTFFYYSITIISYCKI